MGQSEKSAKSGMTKPGRSQQADIGACMSDLSRLKEELETKRLDMDEKCQALQETLNELEESRNRYAALYDFAPVGYVTIDAKGCIKEINLTGAALLGIERQQLLGMPLLALVVKSDKKLFMDHMRRCRQTNEKTATELSITVKNGASFQAKLLSVPQRTVGNPNGLYETIISDISERKKSEEQLQQSEERFYKAFRLSPMSMSISRVEDETFLDVNEAWQRIFGVTREQAIGRTLNELNIQRNSLNWPKMLKEMEQDKGIMDVEVEAINSKGELLTLLSSADITTINGIPCILTTATDITERKRLEKEKLSKERRAAEQEANKKVDQLKKITSQSVGLEHSIFLSKEMKFIYNQALKYHENRSIPVLIRGETGTGKEILAKIIHYGSFENITPFIAVNCAAINAGLFESDLFGYEAGSFTGGLARGQVGKFDLAAGGTLFLDEITEIPSDLQAKLLRVLEEKEYYRVGGLKQIKANARIICSTNADIEKHVESGTFRRDLFYRLKVGYVCLPSLKQRKEEIIPMAESFLSTFSQQKGKRFRSIGKEAAKIMETYTWPGNVRELKNAIDWLTFMYDDEEVEPRHLEILNSTGYRNNEPGIRKSHETLTHTINDNPLMSGYVNQLIKTTLEKNKGNISKTATELGISRSAIYNRLKTMETNV